MEEQEAKDGVTPECNKAALPIREAPSAASLEPCVDEPPQIPVLQQNVGPTGPKEPARDNQRKEGEPQSVRVVNDSVAVRVIDDDDLNTFERRTLGLARLGFWIAVGTFVIAFITGWIFFQQLKEMAGQTDILFRSAAQSRVDAKDASIVTAKQLAILQEQLGQQQDAMRHDQRAWVGAGDEKFDIGPQKLEAEATLKNVGKTPAIEVTSNIAWVGKKKGQILRSSDVTYPRRDVSNGTIFPGQMTQIQNRQPDPIPPYQAVYVERLRSGEEILYVFGKIQYLDIFRVRHWTHFCVVVHQDLIGNSPCDIYTDSDPDPPEK